jgi:lipopolysaccharide export system permease protein
MRILDRSINNSIITVFISSILIFFFLYALIDLTNALDDIIERKIPWRVLLEYYMAYLPIIVVLTSPVACLIGVLTTFAGLQNTNQIIAMRASGMGFWRITRPALFFGLIVSALIFFLNERFVPRATEITKKIKLENMTLASDRAKKQKDQIRNLTFYGLKNRLYYVNTFYPEKGEIDGITIIEYDNQLNVNQKIVALKGIWTGIAWKFFQTQVTTYLDGDVNRPTKVRVYQERLMDIKETPRDFLLQRLDVNTMNLRELGGYINRFADSGAARALNNLKVDYHQKIASPIGNFVIILVGLPFALMVKNRKGLTFTAIGLAVAIGLLYYVTNAVALALGKGGLMPPMIAAWITPFLYSGIGLYVIETKY